MRQPSKSGRLQLEQVGLSRVYVDSDDLLGVGEEKPETLSPPDVIARIVSPDCGCSAARSQSGSSHDCANINRPPYGRAASRCQT